MVGADYDMTVGYGVSVRDAQAKLMPVSMQHVVDLLTGQVGDLQQRISTLRKVLKYSRDRYTAMKVALPFFTCSHFSAGHRRLDNFERADGLILDIDWPDRIDQDIYRRIKTDPRVYVAYVSPSGRGLKLIFGLQQSLSDAAQYTRFYRWFSHKFAETYHLLDVLDFKNCDATRISFLSYDIDLYINRDPLLLDIQEGQQMIETSEEASAEGQSVKTSPSKVSPDVYKEIMTKLGTRPRIKERSTPPVLEQVQVILPLLRQALLSYSIELMAVEGIQYGARLQLKLGNDAAEVNIYHGKRGYSVVTTAKRGTHAKLAETAKHIIEASIPSRFIP